MTGITLKKALQRSGCQQFVTFTEVSSSFFLHIISFPYVNILLAKLCEETFIQAENSKSCTYVHIQPHIYYLAIILCIRQWQCHLVEVDLSLIYCSISHMHSLSQSNTCKFGLQLQQSISCAALCNVLYSKTLIKRLTDQVEGSHFHWGLLPASGLHC